MFTIFLSLLRKIIYAIIRCFSNKLDVHLFSGSNVLVSIRDE